MNILVAGGVPGSGTWLVRGQQIGAALGALVRGDPDREAVAWADVVLVVKRCLPSLRAQIERAGRPWAYDILDAYPQPACSSWSPRDSRSWLRGHVAGLGPTTVIWPNHAMRVDGGGSGVVIPHHARAGQARNPIRERIERVGYEGSARYLDGGLAHALEAKCARRGIAFVVNPARLADVDVVVAMRSARWNGYAQRHWKSAVKLANAHATGTPFIGARESGYEEQAVGVECWADTPDEFGDALDFLAPRERRVAIAGRFLAATFTVEQAAERFREVLCALKS